MADSTTTEWHLSKSVPVTFILAIACQTVALIWFVATLRNDVDANSSAIATVTIRTQNLEDSVHGQAVMMARIDENLKAIRETMDRLARTRPD